MPESETLFVIKLSLFARTFIGNRSGGNAANVTIRCNTLAEFLSMTFHQALPHLKREIVLTEDNGNQVAVWSDKERPDEEDLSKFVFFYDTVQRRQKLVSELNTNILQSWKDRNINCFMHVYSDSLSSNALYQVAKKTLLQPVQRDRAQAATTELWNNLKQQLKEKHGHHLSAQDINWRQWANFILQSEPHLHSQLIEVGPPPCLIHLFSSARSSDGEVLQRTRQTMSIGSNLAGQYAFEFGSLRDEYTHLTDVGKEFIRLQDHFKRRLDALETLNQTHVQMLQCMETSVGPVETQVGRRMYDRVENRPDVDHEE
jgi:hypothetical protein